MAIQFNLLPWREEKRNIHTKNTKNALMLSCVIGLVLGFAYYGVKKISLSDHEKAYELIKNKNEALQPLLKKKKLLDAMKKQLNNQIDSIESLQANRASVTHMVEELSKANNQELFLTEFSLTKGVVNITGIAKNDSQISDLMKKLRESKWYQEPKLLEIIRKPELGDEVKRFAVTSKLLLPGAKNKTLGDKNGK
ncbi:MAG: PilN domain-containing protein [Gammaproteobacteria bacterium]|nr:PilN domain-containing protein [Gammaproteobacteria bacterium]